MLLPAVHWKYCIGPLPAAAAPADPRCAVVLVSPQLKDSRTSCLSHFASVDSPGMPSILRNMSTAIAYLPELNLNGNSAVPSPPGTRGLCVRTNRPGPPLTWPGPPTTAESRSPPSLFVPTPRRLPC